MTVTDWITIFNKVVDDADAKTYEYASNNVKVPVQFSYKEAKEVRNMLIELLSYREREVVNGKCY